MLILLVLISVAAVFIINGIIITPKSTRAINEYKDTYPEPNVLVNPTEWGDWDNHKPHNRAKRSIIIGIGFLLIIVLAWAFYYPSNLERTAYLESFYYSNVSVYETASDLTASYLSENNFVDQIIAGSIEKAELATEISNRIAEWRDGIVAYNQILATYSKWDNNIFIGIFVPNLDPNLKYLQIS